MHVTTALVLQALGRLHPMVVHLPIALLVMAALVELIGPRRERPSGVGFFCLVVGALSAALAAWLGWLFAQYDNPGETRTLFLHRWSGVATASVAVLTLLVALALRARPRPALASVHRIGVILCLVLVVTTAHLGGKSVWGDNFVLGLFQEEPAKKPAPAADAGGAKPAVTPLADDTGADAASDASPPTAVASDPAPATDPDHVDYLTQIQPIFEASCYKCHGPKRKPKGGLRLSDMADVFSGSEALWVIFPGRPDESPLVHRVELSPDDEDFMPKDGEPLAAEQIELIKKWIAQGAEWTELPETGSAGTEAPQTGQVPAAGAGHATAAVERPEPIVLGAAERASRDRAVAAILETGAHAGRIAQNTDEVEVNLGLLADAATDDSLAVLEGLEPCLVSLDLARTGVTGAGLARLRDFRHLRRLRLDHTAVDDSGLDHLSGLESLEYLNLVGTPVTDAGLEHLSGLRSLRSLYLWQTGVTDEGAARLAQALPELSIVRDTSTSLATDAAPAGPELHAPCCEAAAAAGKTCDHPCCVAAAEKGEVCPKCGVPSQAGR